MTETERTEKFLARRSRHALLTALFVMALLVSVAVNVGVWYQAQNRASNAEQTAVSFAQQVQDACADGGLPVDGRDLCPRADEIVEDPAAPPVPEDGQDGKDAPPPTDAQVRGAVEALCARTTCAVPPTMAQVARAVTGLLATGEYDGEDGADALPPDPVELQAMATQAVLVYCEAGPQCDPGENGSDGPTLEEVQAVVAAEVARQIAGAIEDYCAAQPGGTCEGGLGDRGTDGVGIESITCPEDGENAGDWVVDYSDGTSETVPGPCRVQPIIDPSPLE